MSTDKGTKNVTDEYVDDDGFLNTGEREDSLGFIPKFNLPDDLTWFIAKDHFGTPSRGKDNKESKTVNVRFVSWIVSGGRHEGKMGALHSYLYHRMPYESGIKPFSVLCGRNFGTDCPICAAKIEAEKRRDDWAINLKHRSNLIMIGIIEGKNNEHQFKIFDFPGYSKDGKTMEEYLRGLGRESNPYLRIDPKKFAAYEDGAKILRVEYTWMPSGRFSGWQLTGVIPESLDASLTPEETKRAYELCPLTLLNPDSVDAVDPQTIVDFYKSGGKPKIDLDKADFATLLAFVVEDQVKNKEKSKLSDIDPKAYDFSDADELRETIKALME